MSGRRLDIPACITAVRLTAERGQLALTVRFNGRWLQLPDIGAFDLANDHRMFTADDIRAAYKDRTRNATPVAPAAQTSTEGA